MITTTESKFIEKVVIHFDNKKDVEVIDFITSIAGFQQEYKKIVEESGFKYNDNDIKLYIKVKEGSLQWEFIRVAIENYTQTTMEFATNLIKGQLLKKTCEKISKLFKDVESESLITEESDKKSLENAKNILSPSKKDLSSKTKLSYYNKNQNNETKLELEIEVSGTQGRAIHDKLAEIIEQIKPHQITDFTDQVLELKISSNNSIKGVISEISDKEMKIICSEELKNSMITDNQQNPFNMFYIVNGEIKKAGDKIVAYHIKYVSDKGLIEDK